MMSESEFSTMMFSSCPKVFALEFLFGVGSDLERYKVNNSYLPRAFFYGEEDDEFKVWLIEMDFTEEEARNIKKVISHWNSRYKKDYVVPFKHMRKIK